MRSSWWFQATHLAHCVQIVLGRRSPRRDFGAGELRILAYHRVSPARDELAVTPGAFRAQMERLAKMSVQPVALPDALSALRERPAGRYVAVTFDDGYHDVLDHALPVLRELRIPATVLVPTAAITGSSRMYWYSEQPPLLTWGELRDIAAEPLFSIGAHSRTHPSLPRLSDDAAWREIAGSKEDIESEIGHPVTVFGYPAGDYGEREVRMVRDAGYEIAVTADPGANRCVCRPETLRRTGVDRRDSLRVFDAKMDGLLDAPWGWNNLLPAGRRSRG